MTERGKEVEFRPDVDRLVRDPDTGKIYVARQRGGGPPYEIEVIEVDDPVAEVFLAPDAPEVVE